MMKIYLIDDKMFISVSGYGIDREKAYQRIEKLAEDFYLKKEELFRVYENHLKHEKEDPEELNILIKDMRENLQLIIE